MTCAVSRAAATRRAWLETIERHRHDRDAPGSADYWSPRLDTASRDELRAIQDDKITAVAPFLTRTAIFIAAASIASACYRPICALSTTSLRNGRSSTSTKWRKMPPRTRPTVPTRP